jgi:hypothetical protein
MTAPAVFCVSGKGRIDGSVYDLLFSVVTAYTPFAPESNATISAWRVISNGLQMERSLPHPFVVAAAYEKSPRPAQRGIRQTGIGRSRKSPSSRTTLSARS